MLARHLAGPMTEQRRIDLYRDGSARVQGVDLGPGPVQVHAADGTHLVLHVAGHKRWTGLGRDWAYEPAYFEVYEMDERGSDSQGHYVRARPCLSFPVRA